MKTIQDIYNTSHNEKELVGLCVKAPGGRYGVIQRTYWNTKELFCTIEGDEFYDSWPSDMGRMASFKADALELVPIKGVLHFDNEKYWTGNTRRNFCGEWDQDFKLFKGFITGIGVVVTETSFYDYEKSLKQFAAEALKSKSR